MIPEVEQKIYDIIMSHGMKLDKEAWFLLMGMADDLMADMCGVFE